MLLLADSGSTKTDWALIDKSRVVQEFHTEGLNPVHLSQASILQAFEASKPLMNVQAETEELHFFGAGCGNTEGKERMMNALGAFFPQATLHVENDLMASALATCGNEKGIVCILGTGSNCCYFDGKTVHRKNFGLGYLLGDEGSGAWFGKQFLRAYLYGQLPEELHTSFANKYQLTAESIIESVYRKPSPNLFLSSFMPFLLTHIDNPWMTHFFKQGLEEFFESNVAAFAESSAGSVHFTGSVAKSLEGLIRQTGTEKGFAIGNIIARPMEGLAAYFTGKTSR